MAIVFFQALLTRNSQCIPSPSLQVEDPGLAADVSLLPAGAADEELEEFLLSA